MTTTHDDNSSTWRDLADQLTPEQVARFERWEADALKSVAAGRNGNYESPEDIARCFLVDARREAEQNLTDSTFDVPIPAGASGAEHWEDDGTGRWTRPVYGIQRNVAHLSVGITGEQHPDGTVGWAAHAHADDNPATPDQLRQFAAAVLEAADELDRLQGGNG
jgi:hypothetical protein